MAPRVLQQDQHKEGSWDIGPHPPPPAYAEVVKPPSAPISSPRRANPGPKRSTSITDRFAKRAATLGNVFIFNSKQPKVTPGTNPSTTSGSKLPVSLKVDTSFPVYNGSKESREVGFPSTVSEAQCDDPFSNVNNAKPFAEVKDWIIDVTEKRRITVPVKIVAQIISCAIQERNQGRRFAQNDPIMLNDLRLVCRAWNYAAVSSPELWNNLELDLNLWKPSDSVYNLSIFSRAWLDRARQGAPMRLTITGKGSEELKSFSKSNPLSFAGQILSICMLGNWVEWNFDSDELYLLLSQKDLISEAYNMFHDPPTGPLCPEGVRKLSLSTDKFLTLGTQLQEYGLFSTPCPWPHLESLYLGTYTSDTEVLGKEIRGVKPPLYLPATLRFLHVSWSAPDQLAPFLQACPSLEELTLEGCDMFHPRSGNAALRGFKPHLSVKRLVLIKAGCGYQGSLGFVLSLFTFPSLELLKLVRISQSEDPYRSSIAWKGPAIAEFISRCRPINLTLALEDSWLVPQYVLELLACLSVKHTSVPIQHLRVERLDDIISRSRSDSTTYKTVPHVKRFTTSLKSITCNSMPGVYKLRELQKLYFGYSSGRIWKSATIPPLPTIYVRDPSPTVYPPEAGGWLVKPLTEWEKDECTSIQIHGHQYQHSLEVQKKDRKEYLERGKGAGSSCWKRDTCNLF